LHFNSLCGLALTALPDEAKFFTRPGLPWAGAIIHSTGIAVLRQYQSLICWML
jgi:hypothetical protein